MPLKSTLLHLLSGPDHPTRSAVYYRDKELYKHNDNQLSGHGGGS